ncbi:attachment protein [Pseudoroseomonas rhizosphaerae]|uniref:Attachment protein n=1 Tax=Teichococcus rhizosphaerae TaxID=1335062 RepID=A0A2C7ABL1_9PROT|nr:host attachment family protein [Pseudoroseomonas rhizosphaerae]PHK94474.1 attachment protein [Pseudoroseomonas rhizosphaerae]
MPHNLPHNALVVVADGAQAILLRNTGKDSSAIALREESRLTPKNLAEDGPAGARPEDQTPRQTDEATFGKQLAQALFQMKERQAYEALVLVADPQTLGQVRPLLHKTVEAAMVGTLAKDLTNHTAEEIAAILAK